MPARKTAAPPRDEEILSEDDLAGAEVQQAEKRKIVKKAAAKAGTKRKAAASSKESRPVLKERTNIQVLQQEEEQDHASREPAAKKPRTDRSTVRSKGVKSVSSENEVPGKRQDPRAVEAIEDTIELSETAAVEPHTRNLNDKVYSGPIQRAGSARPPSVQPNYVRERSASASGNERDRRGDMELRRQLTAKTRECENLRLKSQALEDLAKTRAISSFERLKEEADEKTKRADDLVASLRKEIEVLRKSCSSISAESASMQKQVQALTIDHEKLTLENEQLTSASAQSKSSFQKSEHERQALEVKLMAARQQVNGGTSDGKGNNSRALPSTSEAQRELKMKENLYTDLTGLIIRGVKRKEGEDEYDCIQTGRNGTLHFHLSVMNGTGSSNPKTPSAYEEAEFSYEPFLDDSRDRELLEILPDYLSEDICFPRNHAVKFYTKVVESMTKRVVVEDAGD